MKTYIKKIIIICVIGIIIYKMVPGIIFFACLFTDDGGKLDEWENVSDFVIENQDNLNRIVNEVLNDKMNIVIEQDEVIAHDNTIAEDETLLQNTEIAWLFENEYVKKIEIKEIWNQEVVEEKSIDEISLLFHGQPHALIINKATNSVFTTNESGKTNRGTEAIYIGELEVSMMIGGRDAEILYSILTEGYKEECCGN